MLCMSNTWIGWYGTPTVCPLLVQNEIYLNILVERPTLLVLKWAQPSCNFKQFRCFGVPCEIEKNAFLSSPKWPLIKNFGQMVDFSS